MYEANSNPSEQRLNATYTAYFDDSEGPSESGRIYPVIAAVLIRQDLCHNVDDEVRKVWERYLPGIDRTEFHATDIEEATEPFSRLDDESRLQLQKDFIQVTSLLDLPVLAIALDSKDIKANKTFGP